jgi:stress-induced-phosphoprotein 1
MSNRELALAAKAKGNAAFSEGRFEEGIAAFTEAISHDSSDHVFFSNRSACYAGLENFEKALEDAKECVKLAPSWAKGYSRLGLALFKLGKYEEAKAAYEDGLKHDPENEQLKEGIESVDSQMNKQANPFGNLFGPDIWMKIQTNPRLAPYLADQDFVSKVNMLQKNPQAISTMLSDPKIQALFGALLGMNFSGDEEAPATEQQSEPEKATSPPPKQRDEPKPSQAKSASAPEPAKKLSPEEEAAENAKAIGNEHFKKREFALAIENYVKAYELFPENPVYLSNICAAYLESGDNEKTIEYGQKVLDLRNTQSVDLNLVAKVFARMGHAYSNLEKYAEALTSFEKSLVEKYDRKIELKRDKIRDLKKKLDAESYLDDVKSLHHKEEGNKYFAEGKWGPAIEEYTEAIKRNPKDAKLYSNRSAALVKLMEWGKALEDANTAIAIDPQFVKAYLRKAKIQFFLKQYHKAIETYKAGLAISPDSDELKEGLMETRYAIAQSNMSGAADPERQKRAMEDPQIQAILQDPNMQAALQAMQTDPKAAQKLMQDPVLREKVETLVAAGVLQVR